MAHSARPIRIKQPVNAVHRDAIHHETVKKELKSAVVYKDFTVNPHSLRKNMTIVSSKPNSLRDALADQEEGDRTVIEVIHRYEQPPTHKYKFPQTESQEIGFSTNPLVRHDMSDVRLDHRRRQTDVTEAKEAEWKLVEQTKKISKR